MINGNINLKCMVRGMLSKWLRIAAAVSCSSDTPGSAGAGFGFGMMG